MKRFRKPPKMFSKFTSMFHSAVEALAPNLPMQQEFITHWKAVTHYFIDNKDHKVSVDQTSLPAHLEAMLLTLLAEEEDSETGSTGPCMEYLLQHKILETLYTLARTDCPPGMKQIVLQFFTKLLSRIKQPLLPHVNVHRPVQRLIRLCGEVTAAPTEVEEIQFVCTVCAKLKADPYLVNFFIETPKPVTHDGVVGGSPVRCTKPCYTLVDALLQLMHSPDARVGVKACEGLMLCASLPEEASVRSLLQHTDFSAGLTRQLCSLYDQLPDVMDPVDVECVEAKWGFDVHSEAEEHLHFPGRRSLLSFLAWLDYCDQLAAIAHPDVATDLAQHIGSSFLQERLQPHLLQASEVRAMTATAHLSRCIRLVFSPSLLREFVYFILGKDTEPEKPEERGSPVHQGGQRLRYRLIERCNHLSEELSITTLKLFEILLLKPHPHISHNLLLRNLVGRGYVGADAKTHTGNSPQDQTGQLSINPSQHTCAKQDPNDQPHSTPAENACANDDAMPLDKTEIVKDAANVVDGQTDANMGDAAGIEGPSTCERDQTRTKCQCSENEREGSRLCDACSVADQGSLTKTVSADSSEESLQHTRTVPGDLPDPRVPDPGEDAHPDGTSANPEPAVDEPPSALHTDLVHQSSTDSSTCTPPASIPPSPTTDHDGEVSVHKIVNSFLTILPEAAKSSYQLGDSGYDTYLRDAHRQFTEITSQCSGFEWPTEVKGHSHTDGFYEGSFLKVVLDRLAHLLNQSYEVNLQVTALVSKLALLPHPYLHEYLLNPFLPLAEGARSLPTVIHKVATDIQSHSRAVPDFQKKVVHVRRQLMGFSENYRRQSSSSQTDVGMENSHLLAGAIVLEEFCKELAAISFVKHHEAQGQL